LVFCGDVLEHVEPACLDAVLEDLRALTLERCVMVIATRPARKRYPDGRNFHLIIENHEWWLDKVCEFFHLERMQLTDDTLTLVVGVEPAKQVEGGCSAS